MQYQGMAIGGPAAGQFLEAETPKVNVPVQTGPDRGEGDHGFTPFEYLHRGGLWWGQNTLEYERAIATSH